MTVRTVDKGCGALTLVGGMMLKIEAIDATTGLAVSGVTCSRWSIYGADVVGSESEGAAVVGPFMLVPGPESSG